MTATYPPRTLPAGAGSARSGNRVRALWRGRTADPVWIRPALLGLLSATGLLYLWNLAASGYANAYYSAAVQAGSTSWKAMFFGSLDSANFITVDKPPASLWMMDLSARVFGLSSWSILAPQAVEGVLSVLVLYLAVRRWAGPRAGLLAGAALTVTPIAALMFRFNNPDALLVLLMTLACYATVRATEKAGARWLFLAGVIIGFAFLTKMLQGLIILPALAAVYLIAAPTGLWRRIRDVLLGGVGVVLGAGWWIAAVQLWPASSRPYIGGTNHNSILELTFGYNGIGRLTGSDNNGGVGGRGGGGGGGGFSSGQTGVTRLFGSEMGTQISWLLPAALLVLVAGLWLTRHRPRTDLLRGAFVLWGGWLIVNGLVFSYASGIIHPYYTVAVAPPIAALSGIGVVLLWRTRRLLFSRVALAVVLAVTAWWTVELLGRTASWNTWLRPVVVVAAVIAVAALFVPRRILPRAALVVVPASLITLLLAPTAYAVQTASSAHSGALPTAGPASTSGFGGPGGRGGPGGGPGAGGFGRGGFGAMPGTTNGGTANGGTTNGGTTNGGTTNGGTGRFGGVGGMRGGMAGGGGPGGALGGASTLNSALKSALTADASKYTWVAATTSANQAASLQLGTGKAVMALGGFNGSDPAITLAQFKKLVAEGRIHYFIGGQFIGSTSANSTDAYQIQQWVTSTFTSKTIGNETVYDLTTS